MAGNSNTEDRDKLIERVRSLLAMGSDASSPNEAIIALRRARSLMDKYQITSIDIEDCTKNDFGENNFESISSQNRVWVGSLAISVAKLNDCMVEMGRRASKKHKLVFVFKGFLEDTEMCNFMLAYLLQAGESFYKRDKEAYGLSGASDKNSYLVGFAVGIQSRVNQILLERQTPSEDLQLSSSTSLVLAKKQMVTQEFGETREKQAPSVKNGAGGFLGRKAAKEAHLGGFMADDTEKHEMIGTHVASINELSALVTELFTSKELPSDWSLTSEEFEWLTQQKREQKNHGGIVGACSFEEIISERCYIDSKTKRLIQAAYVVFDGDFHFKKKEDALECVNSFGFKFTSWDEVVAASESSAITDCHYHEYC